MKPRSKRKKLSNLSNLALEIETSRRDFLASAAEEAFEKQHDLEDELKNYKDIEKKLGVPLTTYHEVMESLYCGADFGAGSGKAFYKKNGEIKKAWILQMDYCKKKVLLGDPHAEHDEAVFLFSSYGDLWSLRREDLE